MREPADTHAALVCELEHLRAENHRLTRLLQLRDGGATPAAEQPAMPLTPGLVTMASPVADKLALFADRFAVPPERLRRSLGELQHRRDRVVSRGRRRVAQGHGSSWRSLPTPHPAGAERPPRR